MARIYKPKKNRRKSENRKQRMAIYNTARWRRLREVKLMNNPLCENCLLEDRTTEAEDVHHMVSFMSTQDNITRRHLAFDYDNLKSLCKECHNKEHQVDNRYGNTHRS